MFPCSDKNSLFGRTQVSRSAIFPRPTLIRPHWTFLWFLLDRGFFSLSLSLSLHWQTLLFRVLWGSQKNWVESTEHSHKLPPFPPPQSVPLSAYGIGVVHFLQLMNQYWYVNRSDSFTWSFTFVQFCGFDKHIMSCIHNYSIVRHSFTAPQALRAPSVHLLTTPLVPYLPTPLATTDHFMSIVWSFLLTSYCCLCS